MKGVVKALIGVAVAGVAAYMLYRALGAHGVTVTKPRQRRSPPPPPSASGGASTAVSGGIRTPPVAPIGGGGSAHRYIKILGGFY